MSSTRDLGSALIEALVIGSVVFVVVMSAVGAITQIAVQGTEATEAARSAAVHAARHDDVASAVLMARSLFPDHEVVAHRTRGSIVVEATAAVRLAHPDGTRSRTVRGIAEMPIAPFRSDHG